MLYIVRCLIIVASCALSAACSANQDVVVAETFEDQLVGLSIKEVDELNPNDSRAKCSGNCSVISDTVAREGHHSVKSYLNRLESRIPFRTETVLRLPAQAKIKMGEDVWYGFSIYVPTSNEADSSSGDTVTQWHHRGEDGGKPPLALRILSDEWILFSRSNDEPGSRHTNHRLDKESWNLGGVAKNVWTDWVFHVRWSWKQDGIIEVWKNGRKIVAYTGPNAYPSKRNVAPVQKFGLYKTAWRNGNRGGRIDPNIVEKTYYHDAIKVARGPDVKYEDVSPLGAPQQPTLITDSPSD